MRINTNLSAMTALNSSTKTTALASNSMEKLSSGLKINKAGDDAAGLAISEKMRSQIRGLDQASQNAQDGISVVQTAEGAIEEIGNITQRMRELAVQSSNETNSGEDRAKIAEELSQLHDEINRIADSTEFNGKNLLNGDKVIGTENNIKLNKTNSDKFEIKESSLAALDLKDGNTVSIETADKGSSNGATTTITVTAGSQTFTADVNGDGTNVGSIAIKGKVTLTNSTTGQTIEIDVKEATASKTASTQLVSAKQETKNLVGSDVTLQIGANTDDAQQLTVRIQNVSTGQLGLGSDKTMIEAMKAEGTSGTNAATEMIKNLDKALEKINTGRANLGAIQNRLETASSNLTTSTENLTAAESRIRDVDVAAEMMNLSKLNLINQAAQAMMTQAKSQPEGVMQLLR